MTIESIEKRIEGKQKEITKLEKRIARFEKLKASGKGQTGWDWDTYDDYDLERTRRELADAQKGLEEYREKLEQEKQKASKRDIKALVDFLADWREKTLEWYSQEFEKYLDEKKLYHAKVDAIWKGDNTYSPEKMKQERKLRNEYNSRWAHVMAYDHLDKLDTERLVKDIARESDRKYDTIVLKVEEYAGNITDAGGLYIGYDSNINGVIRGDKGTVNVNTIGAGGYNIQRYHFRVLVHPIA